MKKEHFLQSEGFKTVAASVLSILIGLAVGSIVILIVGLTSPNLSLSSAWDGLRIVFGGLFSTGRDASGTLTWGFNPTNIGNMLFRAAPLIMTGLSVGMAYKTGLFNIGAPGQYLIGTLVSLSIALGLPSETMSTTLIWLLAFLGGTLAGAIWGAIPGLFKALLKALCHPCRNPLIPSPFKYTYTQIAHGIHHPFFVFIQINLIFLLQSFPLVFGTVF